MHEGTGPLISVVTPMYNSESYLAECIESVLRQTYGNIEYIIVNNCSTDRSLDIALEYAKKDPRIRVHNNHEFLDIIGNHNKAVQLISADSKYCKVVSADDWLFPECLAQMVSVAEANPSVGIVGSYQLSGGGPNWRAWRVRWDELPYPSTVIPGREISRMQLLSGINVFGTPTSVLYRSDLIRGKGPFYPNATAEADTSVCYKICKDTDFGFVHQVLSYERIHGTQQSSECRKLDTYRSSRLSDLIEYGPGCLTSGELEKRLKEILDDYYKFLAVGVVNFKDKEFWNYHLRRLEELGHPLDRIRLAKAIFIKLLDMLFNPKQTIEKAFKR